MNKIIKNTLILAAITVVSGLVLGAAYEVTKDPIAQTLSLIHICIKKNIHF